MPVAKISAKPTLRNVLCTSSNDANSKYAPPTSSSGTPTANTSSLSTENRIMVGRLSSITAVSIESGTWPDEKRASPAVQVPR